MALDRQLDLPMMRAPGEKRALRVAGLFAGIGGLELGFVRAGHHATLLCEIDEAAQAVLGKAFPDVRSARDVCSLTRLPKGTDMVAAGFPCQDLSQAGKTVGIEGSRSGLVGEVFRLLRKQPVPWVVLENVPFMLQLAKGQALDVIVATLEALGYRWAYRVVDSHAFGLPQRRQRVFLVASLEDDPRRVLFADEHGPPPSHDGGDVACGFYWTEGIRGLGWAVDAIPTLKGGSTIGIPSPPAIWLPSGAIVKPDIRDAERMQGFRANWTRPAEAVAKPGVRWKLVGNAVSVPVAKWLGERLAEPRAFELTGVRPLVRTGSWPRAAWNVGEGRMTADISSWPVCRRRAPLAAFLKYEPQPLSERATAGFLKRAESSRLRFPEGFLAAIADHLASVRATAAT